MALIYLLVSDKTPTVVISAIRPTSIQRVWLTAAARPQVPRSHPCTGPKVSPNLGLLYSLFYTSTQMSLQSSFTCCRWLLDRLQVEKVSSSFQLNASPLEWDKTGLGYGSVKVEAEIHPCALCPLHTLWRMPSRSAASPPSPSPPAAQITLN